MAKKKATVISVANQKGGTAKTTTCENLGIGLAAEGKDVLLVDVDPQGNATSGVGVDKRAVRFSSYSVMINDIKL